MKILITGAAGFIGRHLTNLLSADFARIVCLDNFNDYYDPQLKRANAAEISKLSNVEVIEADFCDVEFVTQLFAMEDFHIVVHLGNPSYRE